MVTGWLVLGHDVTNFCKTLHAIIAFKNSHAKIAFEIRILRKNRMRKFAFCEIRISRKFACEKSHFAKNSHAKIRILRKIALCENSQNFASLRKIFLRFFAFASLRKMILKFFRIRIASHFYIQCEGTSLTVIDKKTLKDFWQSILAVSKPCSKMAWEILPCPLGLKSCLNYSRACTILNLTCEMLLQSYSSASPNKNRTKLSLPLSSL